MIWDFIYLHIKYKLVKRCTIIHIFRKKKLIWDELFFFKKRLFLRTVANGFRDSKLIIMNQSSHQLCSTHALTRFSYSRRFSLNSCAAIELAGELGFGSLNKDWMDVRMADTSYVGLHLKRSILYYSILIALTNWLLAINFKFMSD